MANIPPATVTVTSSVGPGQSVSSLKFTDVTNLAVDFIANTIRVQRQGASGLQYFDYSVIATVTWTVSNGVATIAFS